MHLTLLGYPLSHTLSPAMHNAALRSLGLDWRYEARPVPPGDLAGAVAELRDPACVGANVTVPHKQAIVPGLDGLTPVAQAAGAVNTVVNKDGALIGHNTDAAGLLADLHAHHVQVTKRSVLILGAGGAARAAVAACAGVGAQVRVVARHRARAEALQAIAPVRTFDWTPLGFLEASEGCAVIINATPLGMAPDVARSPWLAGTPFPPEAFVYDLVYRPAETRLVRAARAEGCRAATGLGMLVEQGALALELWTGQTAPRAVMRRAAQAELREAAVEYG